MLIRYGNSLGRQAVGKSESLHQSKCVMWEGDYMSSALRKPTTTQIIASMATVIVMGMNVSILQVVMTSFPYIMEAMQISKVEASMMSTVVSVGVVVMALIGTRLIDKLTPRWSMLVGTLLVTAFLVVNAIGLPYIAWVACGLLAGFGSALGSLGAASGLMRRMGNGFRQQVHRHSRYSDPDRFRLYGFDRITFDLHGLPR